MDISGMGISSREYYTGYVKQKEQEKDMAFVNWTEDEEQKAGEQDALSGKEDEVQESGGSQTQIVVKPDGSRVLMVTTRVCGMETTTSLKLSEPTDILHTPKMEEQYAMETSRLDLRESGVASE